MSKRVFLYGGAILWTLFLFIVLSDRMVTDVIPPLENLLVRMLVILAINLSVGSLVRALLVRRATRAEST